MSAPLNRLDVVIVPFPFRDMPIKRRRPALVISGARWNVASEHIVCAMITAARQSRWPLDIAIGDLAAAGLTKPCIVRMKLFTLDAKLVIRRAGGLTAEDGAGVDASLAALAV